MPLGSALGIPRGKNHSPDPVATVGLEGEKEKNTERGGRGERGRGGSRGAVGSTGEARKSYRELRASREISFTAAK